MNGTATSAGKKQGFKGKPIPKPVVYKIIDELMQDPKVSLYPIAKRYGTSHQTVMRIAAGRDAMSWLREDPKWQELNALRTGGPRRKTATPTLYAHQGDGVVLVPGDKVPVPTPKPLPPQPAPLSVPRRAPEKPPEPRNEEPVPDTAFNEEEPAETILEAPHPDLVPFDPSRERAPDRIVQRGNAYVQEWDQPLPPAPFGPTEPDEAMQDEPDADVQATPTDFPGQVSPDVFAAGKARLKEMLEPGSTLKAVPDPELVQELVDADMRAMYAEHPALIRPDEWDNYPRTPVVETEAPRERDDVQESRMVAYMLGMMDVIGMTRLGVVQGRDLAMLEGFVDNLEAGLRMQEEAIHDLQAALRMLRGENPE